ncbi:hypothetical protein V3C99_015588 [Haemonchus contortus]|uniref:Uncharacterized protein n=1 Tax=Haemonchus contortus TaxID=6289 RepID=A0A7I4YXG3_HAECO
MSYTEQESAEYIEETESDLSGSSIWASHAGHSTISEEKDNFDSCTNEGTDSNASSGFEIDSPVIVDLPYSSDDEVEGSNRESSQRSTMKNRKSVTRQGQKQSLAGEDISGSSINSDDIVRITCSEDERVIEPSHVESQQEIRCEPFGVFTEMPSPERPFLRPPSATARELMEIHKNYRRGGNQENLDHSDPSKRPRYLPLAPPYHLLPNTSFFRKTAIKPPPTYCSDGLPPLKRIINRYLASILIDHMKNEEELRIFMQERRRHIQGKNQACEGPLKDVDESMTEGEKACREEQSLNLNHRQKRKPRVVIQHLFYGGQLIHYIQDGNEPPPIPGYFTSAPLIPSNVRITRELNGTAPLEYQQLRTSHGFQFVPFGQSLNDVGEDPLIVMAQPSTTSLAMSPQPQSPPQSTAASDIDEAADDVGEATEFNVVTTERYASISITPNALNLKIAERRVSISRSPQQG